MGTKTPDDFMVSRLLGEDKDSTVVLARDIASDVEYAIKIIDKRALETKNRKAQVERERDIISQLDHPFFVRLHHVFEDDKRIYFALSYASKGDLLTYIERNGRLSRPCAQHYAAELVVALEYLRNLGVVHRDLKPENILLTSEMHICITDFGTARKSLEYTGSASERTSFVGTSNYVPPELLIDKASNINSDLWALGCLIYQMLTGMPPFDDTTDFAIFQKVIKLDFLLPEFLGPEETDLIKNLLKFEPNKRIGSVETGGFKNLKNHTFFRGIIWDQLQSKQPPSIHRSSTRISVQTSSSGSVSEFRRDQSARLSPSKGGTMRRQARPYRNSVEVSKLPATEPDDIEGYGIPIDISPSERERWLSKQMTSTWHHFSNGALILKHAELEKKRGLSTKTRQFLLIEGPRLVYIDPNSMDMKGEVPWSRELKTEVKTFKSFYIHVPGRTYHLIDKKGNAIKWCRKIDDVKQFYFGGT